MLGDFFGKANTFFDRRFLLAYWCPTLLSLSAGILLFSWPKDWEPLIQYISALQKGNFGIQFIVIFGALLLTLVFAHLLQAFSYYFIQFWEGYWPQPLWNWHKNETRVDRTWVELKKEENAHRNDINLHASLHNKIFYEYPSQIDRLLPTQLGNVLRASEDYAKTTYGMDIVFWWPRLWLILPEAAKQQIEDSLALMIALLNFATQIGVITIIGSLYLFIQYTGHWKIFAFPLSGITLVVGINLTSIAYLGAVSQAKVYGNLIRSAVDIYRFDLLKALHQSMPTNLAVEKQLWDNLIGWIYFNEQDNAPWYMHSQTKP